MNKKMIALLICVIMGGTLIGSIIMAGGVTTPKEGIA